MYCSDWSNGIQYQVFDTRPATEFNVNATADAQKRRRTFNVGRVLVLNTPHVFSIPPMCSQYPPMPNELYNASDASHEYRRPHGNHQGGGARVETQSNVRKRASSYFSFKR